MPNHVAPRSSISGQTPCISDTDLSTCRFAPFALIRDLTWFLTRLSFKPAKPKKAVTFLRLAESAYTAIEKVSAQQAANFSGLKLIVSI